MCRFVFYHGPPLRLSALLTDPENSLIKQSLENRERRKPTNGDGFGVAWYGPDGTPGRYRSLTPAWNNGNLVSLAHVIESTCVLAHVRAATHPLSVNEANCHPFLAGRRAFMHNGDLAGFAALRRALLAQLGDGAFEVVHGRTDSEHLFALALDHLEKSGDSGGVAALAAALRHAMRAALELSAAHAPGRHSYLNLVLSDGDVAVVSRFTNQDGYDGESLYWNGGRRYTCDQGVCRMVEPGDEGAAVLVSSERLSDDPGWHAVPRNHLLLIDADRTVRIEPLEL